MQLGSMFINNCNNTLHVSDAFFLRSNYRPIETQNIVLRARLRNGLCPLNFPVLTRWVVRSESINQITAECLKSVSLVILCFPNFSKLRKLILWKWSAFNWLGRNVLERTSVTYILFIIEYRLFVENIHIYILLERCNLYSISVPLGRKS